MFGSVIAAAFPLVSAIFSVGAGLALVGAARGRDHLPDDRAHHRHAARPGRRGRLRAVPGRPAPGASGRRHGRRDPSGTRRGNSGGGDRRRGQHGRIAVLGLYVSGVAFVGSLGLAAAVVVVVTMAAALTLVPAFMGTAGAVVRALSARRNARKAGVSAQQQAKQTAAATHEQHEHSVFARWGRKVSERPWPWAVGSVLVLVVLAIPLFSITLGQPDAGTNPTSDSSRRAYDLITDGFRGRCQRAAGRCGEAAGAVQLGQPVAADHDAE